MLLLIDCRNPPPGTGTVCFQHTFAITTAFCVVGILLNAGLVLKVSSADRMPKKRAVAKKIKKDTTEKKIYNVIE